MGLSKISNIANKLNISLIFILIFYAILPVFADINISVLYPSNNSEINGTNLEIIANISSTNNLSNITLFNKNSILNTTTTKTNNTYTINTSVSEKILNWYLEVCDILGLCSSSKTYTTYFLNISENKTNNANINNSEDVNNSDLIENKTLLNNTNITSDSKNNSSNMSSVNNTQIIENISSNNSFTNTSELLILNNSNTPTQINNSFENTTVSTNITAEIIDEIHTNIEINTPVVWTVKFKARENMTKIKIPQDAEIMESYIIKKSKGLGTQSIKPVKLNGTVINNTDEDEIILVKYKTPAPKAFEKHLSINRKEIIISSRYHYRNVKAYTYLENEVPENSINLYWLINGTKTKMDFNALDTNKNGLIDKIEWIVPHLSNQTFIVEIIVLNVQSYPIVGGNWTVFFNTTGTGNLIIKAVNETTYSSIPYKDEQDLEFLELKCGDKIMNVTVVDKQGREIPYDIYLLKKRLEYLKSRDSNE